MDIECLYDIENEMTYLIEDELVGIRTLREEDKERFYFLQKDAQVNRFIRSETPDADIEERFELLLKPWEQVEREFHGLIICVKPSDEINGIVWYRYFDKKHEIVEIGWKVHPDVAGRGVATTASKLLMTYLEDTFPIHKFIARCDSENKASERIMQKIDLRLEADMKANFKIGDEWRDEIRYGKVLD